MLDSNCPRPEPTECPHAEDSAERAVKKTFAILGIDIDKPEQIEEFRRDLRFAGDLRKEISDGRRSIRNALIGLIAAGIVGALWAGFKIKLGG